MIAALRSLSTGLGVAVLLAAGTAAAHTLQPFEARYEVWMNGKLRGSSQMHLRPLGDGRWEYAVDAEGTGLARLAGASVRQASRFRLHEGRPRLLESIATSEVVLREREVRTVFDWDALQARWEGDIKDDQTGPVTLKPGATNGHLLNLLLGLAAPTAPPGSMLSFPVYERGRMQRKEYRVDRHEPVEVPAGRFSATPLVNEQPDRHRTTMIWYSAELPMTPVRLLQLEKGKPKYELRLVSAQSQAR